jgi:hypothetical protein
MNVDDVSPWEITKGSQLPMICSISVSFKVVTNDMAAPISTKPLVTQVELTNIEPPGVTLSTAVDSQTYQPTTTPGNQTTNPYNF